ncbi:MAG: NAD(P)-dependent oxidoreductase [Rubripirellula sp.]
MNVPRLLISECDRFTAAAADRLRELAEVTLADLDRDALLNALEDVEILWIRLRHQIDREVFEHAPKLRFICSPTTGLNHIDLQEADRRGIQVISLRGEYDFLKEIRATAEHTIGLMLSLLRNVPAAIEHVRQGGWDRDPFCGRELHESTIGVVGYGRLGSLVAKYAKAFDAIVIATDPHVNIPDVRQVPLQTLLAEADIVTIHVNLCDATAGILDREAIERMKPGALLINTSRGELIDESALLDALESGRLRGAALDVLADERSSGMQHHRLVAYARENDNLLITPHIGGCTTESMAKTEIFLTEKLCAALPASSAKA